MIHAESTQQTNRFSVDKADAYGSIEIQLDEYGCFFSYDYFCSTNSIYLDSVEPRVIDDEMIDISLTVTGREDVALPTEIPVTIRAHGLANGGNQKTMAAVTWNIEVLGIDVNY